MRALDVLFLFVVGGVFAPACGGSDTGELFGSGGAAGNSGSGTGATSTGGTTAGGAGGTTAGGAGGTTAGGAGGTTAGGAGGTTAGGTGGTTVGGTGGTTVGGTGGTTAGGTGGTTAGGTGGTTVGGTGGTTAGGGSGGSGGSVGVETCTNGVDDNANGLVDCADPQCQPGYTCAAPAPTGWNGIGYVDTKLGTACPDGFQPPTSLYQKSGLVAGPAVCACGCGTPSNVFCQANLSCNSGDTCTSSTSVPVYGNCQTTNVPAPNANNACKVSGVTATSGQCSPGVKAAVPPTSWSPDTRGCFQIVAGKCSDASQVCVQKLAGAKGPCIAQSGDHSCPSGTPYSQKTLYFDGKVSDTRGCSTSGCSCGGSSGGACACNATTCGVQVNWSNNCQASSLAVVPANGQCTIVKDSGNQDTYWGVNRVGISVTNAGACPASGNGTPTGEAAPSGPVTVCCMP